MLTYAKLRPIKPVTIKGMAPQGVTKEAWIDFLYAVDLAKTDARASITIVKWLLKRSDNFPIYGTKEFLTWAKTTHPYIMGV